MDSHQGAGFAFDMNMDFSNVFASKPNEGETSNSFFFGDEGVDTTATVMDPIMFSTTSQTAFDMPQGLNLDNTSGSTSVWHDQLTPEMQNTLNTFPPTPSHSFDSMYQPNFSALGKRSLEIDADFPVPKRHEAMGDFTLFSPLAPATSSWPLDTQLTPAASIEFGISDEAADMCAMWFNKYAILPSDRHIDSLSQLTGESADAIRHWFGRLMKQGMNTGHGDSAYKSQTGIHQPDQFWNDHSTGFIPQLPLEESTQESITTSELACEHQTTTVAQSANALRGGKKSRCTPTDDISLLSRDSSKIYQCTRKCGKRYGRKCDWKRNEEEGYPCKSWVCSLCTSAGVENVKPCFRKYHFAQHFRNIHPGVSCDTYEEASVVSSETEFPRKCGFCKHRFESRQERIDHIAEHFKQGKCMLDWNDSDDSDNSDNTDNDDDDRPSDDDSDSSGPAHQPPPNVPRGGPNSKYHGSGGGGGYTGGGNSSGGSQGGYFQFQLSQLNEGETGSECYYAQQHIKPTGDLRGTQRHLRCSSEPLRQRSIEDRSSASEGDYTTTLARDAISKSLVQRDQIDTQTNVDQQKHPKDGHPTKTKSSDAGPDWLDVLLESHQRVTEVKSTHSATTRKTKNAKSTADGRLQIWDVSRVTSAAPMFFSGKKLDGSKSTHVDGDPEPGVPPLSSTLESGSRSTQALSVLSPESKAPQTIAANSQSFLSVRFLGSGGFSTVDEVLHRGTNLRLGRKTLKNRGPSAMHDLWKEVSVLQKLRHPHVIRFLGAYSQGDKMSILLSPIADTTLSLWLDRFSSEKPANFSQVITKMFGCLASSVRYLHEQRPVVKHLDIKPQNVLIVEGDGEFPHVVLCDFGISTSDDLSFHSQPLTRQYVAPEVFGGSTRTSAADVWSLGCVYAEMASIAYSQDNSDWLKLRKEFSGRTGKYYWQDVSGLQDRLTMILENAATVTEQTTLRTLKAMLRRLPAERPDATSLTLVFTPAPCCLTWPNENVTYPGPVEELSSVEMLIHEDGIDCRTQLHQHSELTAAPLQSLGNAKNWLDQCSHSHEVCIRANRSEAKTLPTRLLEILPDGPEGRLRVITSASISSRPESIDYVALSYTWNESQTLLTTTTHASMETNIPLSTLSSPLTTAISTAHRLGYKYLWTDSLCVLQDNEADKRDECANMASVFRNAALTLMLDSAADLESAPSCAWDTRVWTLQERLLSHRFLHIGREQMYWECNALKASETFPRGLPLLVWEKAHSKIDLGGATQVRNRRRDGGDAALNSTLAHVGGERAKLDEGNDKLGNFPVFTTSTCGDNAKCESGKDPAVLQGLVSDGEKMDRCRSVVGENGNRRDEGDGNANANGNRNMGRKE